VRESALNHIALSEREEQIVRLVAHEFTTAQIAEELAISTHTVISHRTKVMRKLGARNCAGMVRRGFEIGLLSPNDLKTNE